MVLSDKITLLSQELKQRQKAQQARALLQNLRSVVIETNIGIQAIVDSGNFDQLDVDFTNALLAGWNISKAVDKAFKDSAIVTELLDWSP